MNITSNFASIRFRLAGVLVSVLLLTAFSFTAMVRRQPAIVNAANHLRPEPSMSNLSASAPPQSDKPHTMAATYYSFQDNLKASINLNNKGLVPLEVKPTLFNLAGGRLEVPPVTIDATTFQVFDLAEWAGPGGPTFQQGSLQLFYRGQDMLLGAQIKIVDSASSVIFDEQLAEPAAMFSSRLEGLWWLPTHDSQVSIAISNTTDSILVGSLDRDGTEPKQQGSKELILQPHQTVLIDPAQDLSDRPAVLEETGGISISHSGKPGSVIARAMIQNPSIGFSSAVQFADPGKAKSSKLHGAGLRLGEIAGEELTPMVVARNISDRTAVLHGRIRYIKRDGGEGVTTLREVKLRAGEVKAWEITEISRLQSAGVESAGLEIDYSTQPGSVVVSALSVSRSGNQVFQAPMLDAAAQKSSTGAYPFYMYGTSSTVVYIKNTTAVEQKYVAHLNYEGGNYRMGLKTLAPGETVTIDIRALRDNQTADDEGQTIPPDVAHGQVRWTLIQTKGTNPLALIGRAEQVDEVKAMSSTYACQNCCGDFFQQAYVTPFSVKKPVGQSVTLSAVEVHSDCYGFTYPVEQSASWSSSNPSVATVSDGQVTLMGTGQATITALWNSDTSIPSQCTQGGFLPGPIGSEPCCISAGYLRIASAVVQGFDFFVTFNSFVLSPTGTGGTTNTTVRVFTTPPVANEPLTLFLGEFVGSGGHFSHSGTRPLGTLAATQGTTAANGTFQTNYTAPIFAGEVGIFARFGTEDRGELMNINVPGLSSLGGGANYTLTGSLPWHPDNHYGTATAVANLPAIANDYVAQFPGAARLLYNDMSLEKGGKFDINPNQAIPPNWTNASHAEHRVGINCDVGSSNVPGTRRADLNAIFFRRGVASVNDETACCNHWHLRF